MFTVLMAVYSGDDPLHLEEAFESLCEQTILAPEILLIIDGPISSSLNSVVSEYSSILPLQIISIPENRGLASALNTGLKFASYDIIFRFDSDDICVANRFEKQLNFFLSNNVDVLGGQIIEFEFNLNNKKKSRLVPCDLSEIYKRGKWRNPLNHMTVVYKKSIVLQVGGYPSIPYMEDYALWIKLLVSGFNMMNMPQTLVYARAGDGLIRRRGGIKYIHSEFLLQKLMITSGYITVIEGLVHFFIRAPIFILPSRARNFFYFFFLRKLT